MPPRTRQAASSAQQKNAASDHAARNDAAKKLLWMRPGFLVRRLHQIHVAMFFEECQAANITPVQYAILTVLAVMPGLDQTSLGQEVGLDRTTTADVVRRLEERGLVERRSSATDGRIRLTYLSRKGHTLVVTLHDDMTRAQERMLKPLPVAQQKVFMQLLAQLVEANNQYSRTVLRSV